MSRSSLAPPTIKADNGVMNTHRSKNYRTYCIIYSICVLAAAGHLLKPQVSCAQEETRPLPLESATKEIIKVTEKGLTPQNMTLSVPDSTVFLVNFADSAPMNVAIEFGQRRVHCHSKNLELDEAGIMKTIKPVNPQDFAVLCFPEKGTYPYTVTYDGGVKGPLKGQVVIN